MDVSGHINVLVPSMAQWDLLLKQWSQLPLEGSDLFSDQQFTENNIVFMGNMVLIIETQAM